VIALFVAAALALLILFAIENKDLRQQLELFRGYEQNGTSDSGGTGGGGTDTSPSADTEDSTDDSSQPGQTEESGVWPPEPSGEFAGFFPDLYAVNAPWEIEQIEEYPEHIYLTFDDGPNHMTTQILNHLKKTNVTATFFVIPREASATMMRRIHEEGHAIGVHSYTHNFDKIYDSVEAFLEDFDNARSLIYEQTGVLSDIFRFPGGSINNHNEDIRDDIIAEMERRGFVCFDWNVDSDDVRGASYDTMLREVPKAIHANHDNGRRSIVLFHDAAHFTSWVIDDMILVLQLHPNGYKFRTLSPEPKVRLCLTCGGLKLRRAKTPGVERRS
jgi:peptidoglycan/xylan/chitin deacetylase (PgdA/CDA1 family)